MRVARRQPGAAEELLERYGGLVWSVARRFSSGADAEDAVQEIMLDVWASAQRFNPAMSSEATFITMIARRRMIDRLRKRRVGFVSDDVGDVAPGQLSDAASGLEGAEDVDVARRIMGELREEQQRVITLSVVHGLSHEEISKATELPLGTVKTLIRRGLIQVRGAMRDLARGPGLGVTP